jgi:hypothetical protein
MATGTFSPLEASVPTSSAADNLSTSIDNLVRVETVMPTGVQRVEYVPESAVAAEETPAPEAPAEPQGPSQEDLWEERFQRLAKQEAKIQEERRAFRQQQQELQSIAAFREELQRDPARAIARAGITPDDVFRAHVEEEAARPMNEISKIREEVQAQLQEIRNEYRKSELTREGHKWDEGYNSAINDDAYKIVKAWDEDGALVRQYVVDTYRETGKILTPKESLDTIKDELSRKAERLRAAGLFGQSGETVKAPVGEQKAQQKPKTLTTSLDDSSAPVRRGRLNDAEDKARIVREFMLRANG